MSITFDVINEYDLDEKEHGAINKLLNNCFSNYPRDRSHFRQIPSFRLIGKNDQGIQGHIAITYRWMQLGQTTIKVFGLSDICVAEAARDQKMATLMIEQIAALGRGKQIDFLVLIAWEPKVYESMGFTLVNNYCRWLLIQNDRSLGIAQRRIEDGLMVKPLGNKLWSAETLDFLGTIF